MIADDFNKKDSNEEAIQKIIDYIMTKYGSDNENIPYLTGWCHGIIRALDNNDCHCYQCGFEAGLEAGFLEGQSEYNADMESLEDVLINQLVEF